MYRWTWDWGWGWGWAATVGAVLALAIFVLPWFFFLLNLNTLLDRVRPYNRAMGPSHVWLNFIPVFNLGWFLYTVVKVRDSVKAEYASRGWPAEDDFAYNVGLVAGILSVASFFLWWVPLIGWAAGIGWLVCWIIYWLKTSDLKNRLGKSEVWRGGAVPQPYSGPGGPPAGPYDPAGTYAPPGAHAPPGPYSQPGAHSAPGAYGAAAGYGAAAAGQAPPEAAAPRDDQPRLCAACGAGYDPEDRFCRACGLPLP